MFRDPIKEISAFINSEENKNYKKEYEKLKEENEILNTNLKRCEEKMEKLEKKVNSKKERVLQIYESLSPATKESLKNITRGDVYTALILHAEKLYDIAVYMFNNKKPDFDKIRMLYEITFEELRKIKNLQYQDVQIGEEYDYEKHIKDNRLPKSMGPIKGIILRAPKNKKSIVII